MLTVAWREFPPELRATVEPYVERWTPFLPGWCHRLDVSYEPEDAKSYATVGVFYDQRRAELGVSPLFWTLDEAAKHETVLHEFAHIMQGPLDEIWNGLHATLKGALAAWAADEYRRASDAVVTDMALAVQRLAGFDPGKP